MPLILFFPSFTSILDRRGRISLGRSRELQSRLKAVPAINHEEPTVRGNERAPYYTLPIPLPEKIISQCSIAGLHFPGRLLPHKRVSMELFPATPSLSGQIATSWPAALKILRRRLMNGERRCRKEGGNARSFFCSAPPTFIRSVGRLLASLAPY